MSTTTDKKREQLKRLRDMYPTFQIIRDELLKRVASSTNLRLETLDELDSQEKDVETMVGPVKILSLKLWFRAGDYIMNVITINFKYEYFEKYYNGWLAQNATPSPAIFIYNHTKNKRCESRHTKVVAPGLAKKILTTVDDAIVAAGLIYEKARQDKSKREQIDVLMKSLPGFGCPYGGNLICQDDQNHMDITISNFTLDENNNLSTARVKLDLWSLPVDRIADVVAELKRLGGAK